MRSIGIVCEGDRDYDMLTNTITHFMNEDFRFLWLQPNSEFGTDINGAGWKGVFRWCQSYTEDLYDYLNGLTPKIDLLIIQIDADVARCEKEVYCWSITVNCVGQGREDPLNCSISKKGQCLQLLPPNEICSGTALDRVTFLTNMIACYVKQTQEENIKAVVTVPCDSSDAWVVAAFEDEFSDVEKLNSPWDIITQKKDYHGIRIPGRKKSKKPYAALIEGVCDNWSKVKEKCPQAQAFEANVQAMLMP